VQSCTLTVAYCTLILMLGVSQLANMALQYCTKCCSITSLIYWLMLTTYTYTCIHKQAGLVTSSMNDSIMSDTSSIAPALRNQDFLNGANQHSPIAEAHQPDSE
jgi:hypothetical protein